MVMLWRLIVVITITMMVITISAIITVVIVKGDVIYYGQCPTRATHFTIQMVRKLINVTSTFCMLFQIWNWTSPRKVSNYIRKNIKHNNNVEKNIQGRYQWILAMNHTFCWTGILLSKIWAACSASMVRGLWVSVFALSNLSWLEVGSNFLPLDTSNIGLFVLGMLGPEFPGQINNKKNNTCKSTNKHRILNLLAYDSILWFL